MMINKKPQPFEEGQKNREDAVMLKTVCTQQKSELSVCVVSSTCSPEASIYITSTVTVIEP